PAVGREQEVRHDPAGVRIARRNLLPELAATRRRIDAVDARRHHGLAGLEPVRAAHEELTVAGRLDRLLSGLDAQDAARLAFLVDRIEVPLPIAGARADESAVADRHRQSDVLRRDWTRLTALEILHPDPTPLLRRQTREIDSLPLGKKPRTGHV